MEFLAIEIEKGRDIEWNMVWLKNILRFNEPVLRKYRESNSCGGKGKAVMLKLYSSLAFFDQNFKRM